MKKSKNCSNIIFLIKFIISRKELILIIAVTNITLKKMFLYIHCKNYFIITIHILILLKDLPNLRIYCLT